MAAHSQRRGSLVSLFFVVFALALGGCATMSEEEKALYELRKQDRYVKLQAIETGAPANDHPHVFTGQLGSLLASLDAAGNLSLADGKTAIFTEDELAEIADPIAAAFARATPQQDVIFQSGGARGLFGRYSTDSYTTGRLFVRDGELNVILGVVHERPNLNMNQDYRPEYPVGSRSGPRESGWQLSEDPGTRIERRDDWIRLPLAASAPAPEAVEAAPLTAAPAATPEPEVPTPEPAAVEPSADDPIQQRAREFEQRLRVLDDLKARGLITDEEFRQRRQAILDGI